MRIRRRRGSRGGSRVVRRCEATRAAKKGGEGGTHDERGEEGWCENRGQGLRLGTQVKGVRSAVFWTVSIVSGLFIRDGAAGFAFSSPSSREERAKTELRWHVTPYNGAGIYISVLLLRRHYATVVAGTQRPPRPSPSVAIGGSSVREFSSSVIQWRLRRFKWAFGCRAICIGHKMEIAW